MLVKKKKGGNPKKQFHEDLSQEEYISVLEKLLNTSQKLQSGYLMKDYYQADVEIKFGVVVLKKKYIRIPSLKDTIRHIVGERNTDKMFYDAISSFPIPYYLGFDDMLYVCGLIKINLQEKKMIAEQNIREEIRKRRRRGRTPLKR